MSDPRGASTATSHLPAPSCTQSTVRERIPLPKPAAHTHTCQCDPYKGPDLDEVEPPDNFAVVEPGLYRSALPSPRNFPFVRSLRLHTAIILSPERPVRKITNFLHSCGIHVEHTGLLGFSAKSTWKPIEEEVVKESLEILLCRENTPTLVCDVGGVHLVGMVIGCLRRLQNWNLNAVVSEYRFFAASKARYVNEQFIELFDIDLVTIPENPTMWFVEQTEMDRRDREEFLGLVEQQCVDESGTLLDAGKTPQYVTYYYSSSSPLNSKQGPAKPRIQTF